MNNVCLRQCESMHMLVIFTVILSVHMCDDQRY